MGKTVVSDPIMRGSSSPSCTRNTRNSSSSCRTRKSLRVPPSISKHSSSSSSCTRNTRNSSTCCRTTKSLPVTPSISKHKVQEPEILTEDETIHKLDYGLDCDVTNSTVYMPLANQSLSEERAWFFGWLQCMDTWVLLHSRRYLLHNFASRYTFLITISAAILAITAIILQKDEFLPSIDRIKYTKHSSQRNEIAYITHKKCLLDDGPQCIPLILEALHATLQNDMQKLSSEYIMNINNFHAELRTWTELTYMMRKSMKEISSSLHSLKTDMSQLESSISNNNELFIRKQIEIELGKYDVDKLNIPDFALESSGGSIMETPDTKSFEHNSWITLWGVRLFQIDINRPQNIIQASLQPGSCWAFQGPKGNVVIQLSAIVQITAVTMEHISPKISTTGNINSAPKEFEVIGLKLDNTGEVHLGSFTYDKNGSIRQTFKVMSKDSHIFQAVRLSILSNYGNHYTCVYRFRVHGQLHTEPQSYF